MITSIAFVGGLGVGVWNRGMDLTAALKLYGLLAIGDGLVSQLPGPLVHHRQRPLAGPRQGEDEQRQQERHRDPGA